MAKYAAKGSQLKIEDSTTPGTFINIGQVKSIGGPQISRENIDVTTLDSPQGYKEYIPGFRDGGEMPVDGILDPANAGQLELLEDLQSGETARNFEVHLVSAGKKFTFKAFVTQFEAKVEAEGSIEFSSSLKITGPVALVNIAV